MLTTLVTVVLPVLTIGHGVAARSIPKYEYMVDDEVEFDDSTEVEIPELRDVLQNFTEDSMEGMDYLRWTYVTIDGYEYEGTLDEIKERLRNRKYIFFEAVNEAYRNHRYQRTVFSNDDRIEVNDTEVLPHSAIGKLANGCTGTFIASNSVLTAGHCVYNINTRQWYNGLNIQRKKNCNPDDGVQHIWNTALTTIGWKSHGWRSYDFAVIFYDKASPVFMDFDYNDTLGLDDATIVGYPSDKTGSCQWKCEDPLKMIWNLALGYHCDTYYGMNGGPIMINNNGTNVIYGIHTRDRVATLAYNVGPRITNDRFILINSWIDIHN